jgi:hypothetical protein
MGRRRKIKREVREDVPRNSPRVHVPEREEGRHGGHYCWRTLGCSPHHPKQATVKGTGTESVPTASMEVAPRRTSPGAPDNVYGPLSVTPNGTTSSPTAYMDKRVSAEERRNKTPLYECGVSNMCRFLDWIREKSDRKLVAQLRYPDAAVQYCRRLPVPAPCCPSVRTKV